MTFTERQFKNRFKIWISIYSWNCSTITTLLCRNCAVLSYSCMVRKIFRINLCLLLPEAKKKGGSILLTAGLPQNRSWRSIIPNWQLNGFLCFAFFDSIKRRSMARSLSQPHCKYFHYQKIQFFTVAFVKLQLAVNYPKLRVEWVPLICLLWFNKKKSNGLLLLSLSVCKYILCLFSCPLKILQPSGCR